MRPGGLLTMAGLSLALAACAAVSRPEIAPEVTRARHARLEPLVAPHGQKAETFEQEGDLRRALEEWKIALTINPDHPAAQAGRKRLEGQIEQAVSNRIAQAREALGRGAHLEARRHFLAALALDPANKIAFEALQTEVKEIRFVTHTVRQGETLATIAQRYYGDRSRSEVIWETNHLPPNPTLMAGAPLKIPEIPGVPFLAPEVRPQAPSDSPKGESPKEETLELNPLLADAREALEKGEYSIALADVDKLLASNPKTVEGIDLKKAILYQLGKAQFDQKKYEESYQTLTQLAKVAPDYQDSGALLRRVRTRLVQQHYRRGLHLFQEERLEEAIVQWRIVLELDPQHASAKKNIEQAQRLLKELEQLRKK